LRRHSFFEVKAIQAEHGDALLVTYGVTQLRLRHILVDGGPAGTLPKLLSVLEGCKRHGRVCLEALVVTHYDLDHIKGIIELLQARPEWLDIKNIWFNGYHHIAPFDILGAADGDTLGDLIELGKYPWNRQFGGGPIVVGNELPLKMPGGLKVWILSPDQHSLSRLAAEWGEGKVIPESSDSVVAEDLLGRKDKWPPLEFADLASTPCRRDSSVPNGSSIALLLEFHGHRMLLAGDSFTEVVSDAIEEYWNDTPPVIHLLKVSHHGSTANTNSNLLQTIQCKRFLISTNGKIHGHPDHALIARLVASTTQSELIFNYDCECTTNWRNPPADWPRFSTRFPHPAESFVRVAF